MGDRPLLRASLAEQFEIGQSCGIPPGYTLRGSHLGFDALTMVRRVGRHVCREGCHRASSSLDASREAKHVRWASPGGCVMPQSPSRARRSPAHHRWGFLSHDCDPNRGPGDRLWGRNTAAGELLGGRGPQG